MSAAVKVAPFAAVLLLASAVRADDAKPAGFVGMEIKPADDGKGFAVTRVVPGAPAEKAGLKADDVILKINDKDVSEDLLNQYIKQGKSGDQVTLTVKRDGKEQEIKITMGTRPKNND